MQKIRCDRVGPGATGTLWGGLLFAATQANWLSKLLLDPLDAEPCALLDYAQAVSPIGASVGSHALP
jgi:hypothetical protein